jgi:hypothetical protein
MKIANTPLMTNVVMNDDLESDAIQLTNIFGYTVQAVYVGTPTGTFKLQASVDPIKFANDAQPQVPTNWNDIAGSSFAVTSSGITTWNVTNSFYTFVRLVYADGSGGSSTAVLNAVINVKGA